MNTGLVWYSNSRFVSGCLMVQYSNGGLKTGLKKDYYLWSVTRLATLLEHVNLWFWKVFQSKFYKIYLLVISYVKVGDNGAYSEGIQELICCCWKSVMTKNGLCPPTAGSSTHWLSLRWLTNKTKKFMVQNVQDSNGLSSNMTSLIGD